MAFLTLLLFNLFISEPQHALQDVLEVNFGFQVTSVAGKDFDPLSNDEETSKSEQKPEDAEDPSQGSGDIGDQQINNSSNVLPEEEKGEDVGAQG